jgi:hypothetical protein
MNVLVLCTGNSCRSQVAGAHRSAARDVSDEHRYVGEIKDSPATDCLDHAVYWEWEDGEILPPVDLHLAGGGGSAAESQALAIRNHTREVVGFETGARGAMRWQYDGSWTGASLDDLICDEGDEWDLREAHDVNDAGWIVGWGTLDGIEHAFVLVPIERLCPIDVSGAYGIPDGIVDVSDLLAVLGQFSDDPCPSLCACSADTNGDGRVNVTDLLNVLGAWGSDGCGGAGSEIPETIQDCIDKFGYEDPEALEACIEFVTGGM